MSTDADIGLGTLYQLHNGEDPGALEDIAEITNLTPPGEEDEEVEATHLQSTAREYIAGIPDFGEVEFTINFVPGSATETRILAAKASRQARAQVITFPNGWTWSYNGLIKAYKPGSVTPDGKMEATVTVRVTGSVVRAEPAS